MPREAAAVAAITRLLKARGAWQMNVHGSTHGRNGLPDIIACHRGHLIAIEVKSPTGRPTRLQQYELARIKRAGGSALIARDTTELEQLLDRIDQDSTA